MNEEKKLDAETPGSWARRAFGDPSEKPDDVKAFPVGDFPDARAPSSPEDVLKNSSAMTLPIPRSWRDRKTGALCSDPGPMIEVLPGVMVRQTIIDQSVGETNSAVKEIALIEARKARAEASAADMKRDIEVSKQIAEAIVEKAVGINVQLDMAEEVLCLAMQREEDKWLHFTDVTGKDPRSAAKKVLDVKSVHPSVEIEPIDLSHALDDTKLQKEMQVTELLPTMLVQKHIADADLPAEIRLFIPSVDLPADASLQPDDISHQMVRYVHYDSMPPELRNVVMLYLSMRRGDSTSGVKGFKQAARNLYIVSRDLVDDPKQPAVVTVDDAIENTVKEDHSTHWRKLAGIA